MVKIDRVKETKIEARVLHIQMPVDSAVFHIYDQHREEIALHSGFLPEFIPNHDNEFLSLEIDLDTGEVIGWKPPTISQIEELIDE